MENLLDIEYKDGSRFKLTRFTCECLSPHCSLDVDEEWLDKDASRLLTLSWWADNYPLALRLRWMWRMLTEGRGFEADFIVREEDCRKLADIIGGKSW